MLALEILGQILESGFVNENYRNRNLYREKITGDELFKLKDICELLVADYRQVVKAMNNNFVTFLCNKNV